MGRAKVVKSEEGDAIQVLAPHGAAVNGNIGASSARLTLPSADVVRVSCSIDTYVRFGDVSVNADSSSMLFLSGTEVFKVPEGAEHLAFIAFGAETGRISVMGLGLD